jgi:hypothetical protein
VQLFANGIHQAIEFTATKFRKRTGPQFYHCYHTHSAQVRLSHAVPPRIHKTADNPARESLEAPYQGHALLFACSLLVVACDLLFAPCYGRSFVTLSPYQGHRDSREKQSSTIKHVTKWSQAAAQSAFCILHWLDTTT